MTILSFGIVTFGAAVFPVMGVCPGEFFLNFANTTDTPFGPLGCNAGGKTTSFIELVLLVVNIILFGYSYHRLRLPQEGEKQILTDSGLPLTWQEKFQMKTALPLLSLIPIGMFVAIVITNLFLNPFGCPEEPSWARYIMSVAIINVYCFFALVASLIKFLYFDNLPHPVRKPNVSMSMHQQL